MKPGDIYAFYNERIGAWNACQITGIKPSEEGEKSAEVMPSVLLFDWQEDRPPELKDFARLKPFVKNWYAWKDKIEHCYMRGEPPEPFKHCGHHPPLLPGDDLRSYNGWRTLLEGQDFVYLNRWKRIPETQRSAFKVSASTLRSFDETDIPQRLPNYSGFADLDAFPKLDKISWRIWSEGLARFLAEHPVVDSLTLLDGGQPETLDFSATALQKIGIDKPDGVREIFLGKDVEWLSLRGTLSEHLVVHAPDDGKWLELHLQEGHVFPVGLPRLREVGIANICGIQDVSLLPDHYPDLRVLRLWGQPGKLAGLAALGKLKNLRWFTTQELFGFSGEDFPPPAELPALKSLWMESLPADAARIIKKKYQPLARDGHFDLDIRKPRTPEWLAENLHNPFRGWDGDDFVPKSCAKKAFDIYKATRKGLLETCAAAGQPPETLMTRCAALCRSYIEVFNTMDGKRGFDIDTVLREEIIEALDTLLTEVKAQTGAAFDEGALMNVCDELRDF